MKMIMKMIMKMGMGLYMNINNLIEYIEKNFRSRLYREDYEILENIVNANYRETQIKQAVDYCKDHYIDSLRYLHKVLINMKKDTKAIEKPLWMDSEIKAETMSDAELREMEELMKPFMED